MVVGNPETIEEVIDTFYGCLSFLKNHTPKYSPHNYNNEANMIEAIRSALLKDVPFVPSLLTEEGLDRLKDLMLNADLPTFETIFGKNLGSHLFEIFKGLEHEDMMRLWDHITSEPRRKLVEYLNHTKP